MRVGCAIACDLIISFMFVRLTHKLGESAAAFENTLLYATAA